MIKGTPARPSATDAKRSVGVLAVGEDRKAFKKEERIAVLLAGERPYGVREKTYSLRQNL